jgi:NAD(P)-dependent dehydrogenase (short-subunit alcohol dehydrogenase family)
MSKVLIYGGAGGIGSALARRLHAQQSALHLVGRDAEKLSGLSSELGATFTVGDVTDPALFPRVAQEAGETICGLVYAVGTINLKSFPRMGEADLLRDFQVNAAGAALAVQSALPALRKHGSASVVLFSSVAASQGFSFHSSIGMAKAAVNGLTLALAAELAPHVRVNAIAPSLTKTPLAASLTAREESAAAIAALHALGRLGEPDDIASLAAFLLSSESSWLTGQIIGVDGGRATLRPRG